MSGRSKEEMAAFYAETYDASVGDWPGEIEFYREMSSGVQDHDGAVLEIACGTGRVALRLAEGGTDVVGLDCSPQMLAVARRKSAGAPHVRWVQADMCAFDLGETFNLVIVPGHAFQNLNTPQDQVACLACIRRHLRPGGTLIVHLDHQNIAWLGGPVGDKGGRFEPAERFLHPRTGQQVRTSRAWSYQPASQTAICQTTWEVLGLDGQVVDTYRRDPIRLHCAFRLEIEHLLARVGLAVEAVYGDFYRRPLKDGSSEMIWVAKRPQTDERMKPG
jgi:SAM-dependent methyltransferase